jgi:DNA-binding NtrC family response regulator
MARILIVEDEEITRTLYKRLLDRLAYPYDMVSSIQEARKEIASKDGYTLLVTDMRLPDGHGTDILVEFRARNPAAKVLIVTGSPELPSFEMKSRPGEDGAEWLFKPFELDDFIEVVTRLFNAGRPS